MKRCPLVCMCLLFLSFLVFHGCDCQDEVLNIYDAKNSVVSYHENGGYIRDVASITDQAKAYIDRRMWGGDPHLAVVFDIDDTLLSSYEFFHTQLDFGYIPDRVDEWTNAANAPAIAPVCDLFNYAADQGITVFIITGRPESQLEATVANLELAGCGRYTELYMKTSLSPSGTVEYKSQTRRQIQSDGYRIIVNIGDQWSDLDGGFSERTFKLPNHMYFVP